MQTTFKIFNIISIIIIVTTSSVVIASSTQISSVDEAWNQVYQDSSYAKKGCEYKDAGIPHCDHEVGLDEEGTYQCDKTVQINLDECQDRSIEGEGIRTTHFSFVYEGEVSDNWQVRVFDKENQSLDITEASPSATEQDANASKQKDGAEKTAASDLDQMKYLHYKFSSNVFALGHALEKECKAEQSAKSYHSMVEAALTYSQNETQRQKTMLEKLSKLEQRMKDAKNSDDKSEIQLLGLHMQARSIGIQIENLIGMKGRIPNRLEFIEDLEISKIHSAYEVEHFLNEVGRCESQIDRSLAAATKDCERVKREEVCSEDGSECTMKDVPDPVEGSCEAASSIPFLTEIINNYDEHSISVAPSALMNEGFSNLVNKYDRFVSMNVPQGRWSGNLNRCQTSLDKLYSKTEAICGNVRKDGEDTYEWDIPQEGDFVTDMYESILGRNPDNPGYHYWQEDYKKLQKLGKTQDEIVSAIKHSFYNSAEYFGDDEKMEEVRKNNEQYAIDNRLDMRECSSQGCLKDIERLENEGPQELSAEAKERLDRLGDEAMKFLSATMNEEDFELLVNMSLESFAEVDLLIGQSFLRTNLIEGLAENVEVLNQQDKMILEKLNSNLYDVNKMIEQMRKSSVSAQGGIANIEQNSARDKRDPQQSLNVVKPDILAQEAGGTSVAESLIEQGASDQALNSNTLSISNKEKADTKTAAPEDQSDSRTQGIYQAFTPSSIKGSVSQVISGKLSKRSKAISPKARKALKTLEKRKAKIPSSSLQSLTKSKENLFNNNTKLRPKEFSASIDKKPALQMPNAISNIAPAPQANTNKKVSPSSNISKTSNAQNKNTVPRIRRGKRSGHRAGQQDNSISIKRDHSRKLADTRQTSNRIYSESAGRFNQSSKGEASDEVGSRDEDIFEMITNRYKNLISRFEE